MRKKESYIEDSTPQLKLKVKIFIFLFSILGIAIINLILSKIINKYLVNLNIHYINTFSDTVNTKIQKSGFLAVGLTMVIIAPVIEELLCRSWIIIKRSSISLFLTALLYFPINLIFKKYHLLIPGAISIFLLPLIYFFLNNYLKIFDGVFLKINKKTNKFLLITISSIAFGLIHIFNAKEFNFYLLILILPQISGGFILGFLRLKNGLIWSILLHSFINAVPFIPFL